MSTFLLVAAMLAAGPAEGVPPAEAVVERPLVPPRTGRELESAIHTALRRWAKPTEVQAKPAARDFLVLYNELQRDTVLARTTRDQLAAKLRGRLAALARQIEKQQATANERPAADRPGSVDLAGTDGVLAQWGGGGRQPGGFGGGMGVGGGMGFGGMGGQGAVKDDAGDDLVELIQKTISPGSWDRNGGPGSIYYWRPGRAIVVSAGGDVHDQVGDLLEQMNRLGH
jgi:hypothetical protein